MKVLFLLAYLRPDCWDAFLKLCWFSQCSLMKKKLLNEKSTWQGWNSLTCGVQKVMWLVIIYQNSKCNTHSLGVSRISGNVISKNLQYLMCWEMTTTPHNIELVLRWLKWVSKLNTTSTEALEKRKKKKKRREYFFLFLKAALVAYLSSLDGQEERKVSSCFG